VTAVDRVVDARGLRCPLPVIRLAEAARSAPEGTVVEVWATDPAAAADIPAWCRLRGHQFLGAETVPADMHSGADAGGAGAGDHAAYLVRLTAGA
jgi:TusA-related sulfurtransferase